MAVIFLRRLTESVEVKKQPYCKSLSEIGKVAANCDFLVNFAQETLGSDDLIVLNSRYWSERGPSILYGPRSLLKRQGFKDYDYDEVVIPGESSTREDSDVTSYLHTFKSNSSEVKFLEIKIYLYFHFRREGNSKVDSKTISYLRKSFSQEDLSSEGSLSFCFCTKKDYEDFLIASNHEDGREKKKFTTIVDEVLKDFFPGWSKGRCKLSDDEDAKGYYDEALSEGNLSPIKNPYVTFYGGDLEFLIEETGVIEEIDRQLEEFKTDVDSDDRDLIYTKISNKLRKLVVDNDIVKKVSKVSEDNSDTWYEEGSTGEFDYLILSPGGGSPSYLIFEG